MEAQEISKPFCYNSCCSVFQFVCAYICIGFFNIYLYFLADEKKGRGLQKDVKHEEEEKYLGCIFKVGDDVRQVIVYNIKEKR